MEIKALTWHYNEIMKTMMEQHLLSNALEK
jgi:hypothetical protein